MSYEILNDQSQLIGTHVDETHFGYCRSFVLGFDFTFGTEARVTVGKGVLVLYCGWLCDADDLKIGLEPKQKLQAGITLKCNDYELKTGPAIYESSVECDAANQVMQFHVFCLTGDRKQWIASNNWEMGNRGDLPDNPSQNKPPKLRKVTFGNVKGRPCVFSYMLGKRRWLVALPFCVNSIAEGMQEAANKKMSDFTVTATQGDDTRWTRSLTTADVKAKGAKARRGYCLVCDGIFRSLEPAQLIGEPWLPSGGRQTLIHENRRLELLEHLATVVSHNSNHRFTLTEFANPETNAVYDVDNDDPMELIVFDI